MRSSKTATATYMKTWHARQADLGLCTNCKEPRSLTINGKPSVFCEKHRRLNHENSRKQWLKTHDGVLKPLFDLDSFVNLNHVDLSYVGALFDGEGHLGIIQRKARNLLLHGHIAVGMADREPPEFCYKLFGGSIYLRPSYVANCQPTWTWRCSGRRAGAVAKAVKPYLKIPRNIDTADKIVRLAEVMGANYWRIFQDKELLERRTRVHGEIRASL